MNKRKGIALAIGVIALVVWKMNQSDRPPQSRQNANWQAREVKEPCQTADEWLKRWDQDMGGYHDLTHLQFAELPPESEWPTLLTGWQDRLDRSEQNPETLQSNFSFRGVERTRRKQRLFHALLSEDQDAIEKASREMVKNSDWHSYGGETGLHEFLSLQKDSKEGMRWLQDNGWSAKNSSLSPSTISRESREDWEENLAKGKTEEALELLWKLVVDKDAKAAARILKIARALEDNALEQRALSALKEMADRASSYNAALDWTTELIKQKRWQEFRDLLHRFPREQNGYDWGRDGRELAAIFYLDGSKAYLEAYAEKTERMSESQRLYSLKSDFSEVQLSAIHIEALAAEGRREDAINVAQHLLAGDIRNDDLHRQFRALDATAYEEFLQRLRAFDPMEERPLIWQAQIALEAGDTTKARNLVEQAIALDPADGDQGAGSRMLAYEVLARVLSELGDDDKAKFFQEVVASIREGEKADEFRYAGMTIEAVKRYQSALGRFNDAYCLQSRLALTLAREGRFEEAVPHFEKAFELMPMSFGPRESHCFGCEGLFSDKRIITIATRILTDFSKRHPQNARAPYLLGLVFDSADHPVEAAMSYRKAVEMDPAYFNAARGWVRNLMREGGTHEEYKIAIAALAASAPYANLDEVYGKRTDLAQAWRDAGKIPPSPLKLQPFPIEVPKSPQPEKQDQGHLRIYPQYTKGADGWSREELFEGNFLFKLGH